LGSVLFLCAWGYKFCSIVSIERREMNTKLQDFARQKILDGLGKLEPEHHLLFRRMYSHKNLDADLENVVQNMPEDKLDWAMQQVQKSVDMAEAEKGVR